MWRGFLPVRAAHTCMHIHVQIILFSMRESFKATVIHHFWAGRVHTHTHTHPVIALCNRRRTLHVQLQSITCATEQPEVKHNTHTNAKYSSVVKPSSCFGQLKNYVNSGHLHVFFSRSCSLCKKQAPYSHALSHPWSLKTCATNAYQRRIDAAIVWRYSTWLHHVSTGVSCPPWTLLCAESLQNTASSGDGQHNRNRS